MTSKRSRRRMPPPRSSNAAGTVRGIAAADLSVEMTAASRQYLSTAHQSAEVVSADSGRATCGPVRNSGAFRRRRASRTTPGMSKSMGRSGRDGARHNPSEEWSSHARRSRPPCPAFQRLCSRASALASKPAGGAGGAGGAGVTPVRTVARTTENSRTCIGCMVTLLERAGARPANSTGSAGHARRPSPSLAEGPRWATS